MLNYKFEAERSIRTQNAALCAAHGAQWVNTVLDLLGHADEYDFPAARQQLNEEPKLGAGLSYTYAPVSLRQPICISAPWQMPFKLVGQAAREQSTKRIALCWEAHRGDLLVEDIELFLAKYPAGGILVLSIYWRDATQRWEISDYPAFLPHMPCEVAHDKQISDANEELLSIPIHIQCGSGVLLAYPAVSRTDIAAKNPREIKITLESITKNLSDEIRLAAHALPIIAAAKRPSASTNLHDEPRLCRLDHVSHFALNTIRSIGLYEKTTSFKPPSGDDWLNQLKPMRASRINLFTGVNGGGKSTVIDTIMSMRDATKLAGLQRENTKYYAFSGFHIHLINGRTLIVTLDQINSSNNGHTHIDWQTAKIYTHLNGNQTNHVEVELPKFYVSEEEVEKANSILRALDCEVQIYDARHPPRVDPKAMAEALCEIAFYLPNVEGSRESRQQIEADVEVANDLRDDLKTTKLAQPITVDEQGRFHIWFCDDIGQPSRVSEDLLPSGWRAFGKLTAWLSTRPQGSICLLEEPETHLHPTFQRLLIQRLGKIAEARSLQLFIATHSATLINTQWWEGITPKLFRMRGRLIEESPNMADLLRDLGVRQSDLQQANGIIWVEGPSDAVYLRYWLMLYCKENNRQPPMEDLEFCFALYGGAVLSHFSVGHAADLINILRINTNMVMLMDRDLDFDQQPDGTFNARDPESAKARMKQTVEQLRTDDCWPWITPEYTIENYLPDTFKNKYFTTAKTGRLEKHSSYSKVDISRKFVDSRFDYDVCFGHQPNLAKRIGELVDTIARWNII